VTAKTVAVEQTGKAHGAPEHDAQYGCMPVVSKLGIGAFARLHLSSNEADLLHLAASSVNLPSAFALRFLLAYALLHRPAAAPSSYRPNPWA